MVHPFLFIFPLRGLPGPGPKKTSKEEDPKQTQSRPINPKQPGITQGFPALFSQLAFFKASFWETPCRGRGSLYISAGLDGAPVSFHFSSSGLARGQAPRRPPKKKTQSRPKADQSTQSSLESPKAFRLYSLDLSGLYGFRATLPVVKFCFHVCSMLLRTRGPKVARQNNLRWRTKAQALKV